MTTTKVADQLHSAITNGTVTLVNTLNNILYLQTQIQQKVIEWQTWWISLHYETAPREETTAKGTDVSTDHAPYKKNDKNEQRYKNLEESSPTTPIRRDESR